MLQAKSGTSAATYDLMEPHWIELGLNPGPFAIQITALNMAPLVWPVVHIVGKFKKRIGEEFTESPQDGVHPVNAFPARGALAAGLVLVERHQPVQEIKMYP